MGFHANLPAVEEEGSEEEEGNPTPRDLSKPNWCPLETQHLGPNDWKMLSLVPLARWRELEAAERREAMAEEEEEIQQEDLPPADESRSH